MDEAISAEREAVYWDGSIVGAWRKNSAARFAEWDVATMPISVWGRRERVLCGCTVWCRVVGWLARAESRSACDAALAASWVVRAAVSRASLAALVCSRRFLPGLLVEAV